MASVAAAVYVGCKTPEGEVLLASNMYGQVRRLLQDIDKYLEESSRALGSSHPEVQRIQSERDRCASEFDGIVESNNGDIRALDSMLCRLVDEVRTLPPHIGKELDANAPTCSHVGCYRKARRIDLCVIHWCDTTDKRAIERYLRRAIVDQSYVDKLLAEL